MNDKMRIDNPDLSPKQRKAIVLMARGMTITDVAKSVGVSEQTIYNWKTDEYFLEDLKDETREYLKECRTRLGSLSAPAIETLALLLSSENQTIQFKAAMGILRTNGLHKLDAELFILQGLGLETPLSKDQAKEDERLRLVANLTSF